MSHEDKYMQMALRQTQLEDQVAALQAELNAAHAEEQHEAIVDMCRNACHSCPAHEDDVRKLAKFAGETLEESSRLRDAVAEEVVHAVHRQVQLLNTADKLGEALDGFSNRVVLIVDGRRASAGGAAAEHPLTLGQTLLVQLLDFLTECVDGAYDEAAPAEDAWGSTADRKAGAAGGLQQLSSRLAWLDVSTTSLRVRTGRGLERRVKAMAQQLTGALIGFTNEHYRAVNAVADFEARMVRAGEANKRSDRITAVLLQLGRRLHWEDAHKMFGEAARAAASTVVTTRPVKPTPKPAASPAASPVGARDPAPRQSGMKSPSSSRNVVQGRPAPQSFRGRVSAGSPGITSPPVGPQKSLPPRPSSASGGQRPVPLRRERSASAEDDDEEPRRRNLFNLFGMI
jgi:hypothetical protein